MQIFRFYWIFCLGLFFYQVNAGQKFKLAVDYAQFRYDENANYVEIYYQSAPCEMELKVVKGDTIWAWERWQNVATDSNFSDELIGRVYFLATKGKYQVFLKAKTKDPVSQTDSVGFEIVAIPFQASSQIQCSDIELASSIEFSSLKEHPFYKNSFLVVPKPSLTYGIHQPLLYYYCEIYNLLPNISTPFYFLNVHITDSIGNAVPQVRLIEKKKTLNTESLVEYGEIGLFSLPEGAYWVHIDVLDGNRKCVASREKRFFVEGEKRKVAVKSETSVSPGYFDLLDEKELQLKYEQSKYLMRDEQKAVYSALKTLDARRKFLTQFWKELDPNPQTGINEKYEEYQERIRVANLQFGTFQTEGWKTDRGRVFILYGPPNDVEHYPSSSDYVPYEVWHYDAIEGGVDFVFADLSGFKNYVLIHSSKKGEVYNPDYTRMIRRGF